LSNIAVGGGPGAGIVGRRRADWLTRQYLNVTLPAIVRGGDASTYSAFWAPWAKFSASPLVRPPLTKYSFSVEAYVKALTRAAVHFFAEGRLRAFRKTIPLEVVKPDGALGSSMSSP
jgi:hypothetical protein